MIPTPTPIPIDNFPEPFGTYITSMFQNLVRGLKGAIIPFTHASIWDFIIWTFVISAVIKAVKLMYGKGDSSHHE